MDEEPQQPNLRGIQRFTVRIEWYYVVSTMKHNSMVGLKLRDLLPKFFSDSFDICLDKTVEEVNNDIK